VDCLGFEPRNLLRARELLCQLELAAQGRRALQTDRQGRARRHLGRPGACRYGAHAMEFSINQPAERRARTTGIEPALTALETVVLPLNYVPEDKKCLKI
jgi:hypothetical protein